MKKAFTLVELLVVIAIIAILASLAVPNYQNYMAKAKQAEVAINLASLHAAEQLYWAEHGTYTSDLGSSGAGWQPAGHAADISKTAHYYTYGFGTQNHAEGTSIYVGKLGTTTEHFPSTSANQQGFVAAAAAVLFPGKGADVWTIDEQGVVTHVRDGLR